MTSSPLENLVFVLDYFDGPITGVAFFHGVPHYFDAEFDEVSDSYTQRYRLTALSEETMKTVAAARATWLQKLNAGHRAAAELENGWKALKADMDKMIAHDATLASPLLVTAHFVRLRETGTDEESFAVAWTPVSL
jgi:hypothetical protein